MTSFKIIIKHGVGIGPAYLRVTNLRRHKYVNLGFRVDAAFFNAARERVTPKHGNDRIINNRFSQILNKCNE